MSGNRAQVGEQIRAKKLLSPQAPHNGRKFRSPKSAQSGGMSSSAYLDVLTLTQRGQSKMIILPPQEVVM